MTTLVIDWLGRPHTSNLERQKHWRALSPIHKQWREAGAQAAMVACVGSLGPSEVTAQARYRQNRMTDPDACAPALKCVIDGLVDRGVWPDDTAAWIRRVSYLPPVLDRDQPDALIVTIAPAIDKDVS